MNARQLKLLYVDFFVAKNHQEIPPASLIPDNDPTTLFVSAGIQPLVPYFLGQTHPVGKRLVNVQKCIRTGDIEEVGDAVHHTFFEMLGNWSLGDYFKTEMIPWSFEFLTKSLNIPVNKLAISCFAGDKHAPKDDQTANLWIKQGIPPKRIAFLSKQHNWWGPPGIVGPCGTDTEMFFWVGNNPPPATFDHQDPSWVEIWNDVLIQYFKNKQGQYDKLTQNNIDTGMGVERTVAILNGYSDNYLTSIWQPIIKKIEFLSQKPYQDDQNQPSIRIIADHIRAAVFIISESIEPSNKEAGYILRRLIRRSIRQAKLLGLNSSFCSKVGQSVLDNQHNLAGEYPELDKNKQQILDTLDQEEDKFRRTLDRGLKQINKLIQSNKLDGKTASNIYQSFGFPLEMIQEEAKKADYSLSPNFIKQFNKSMEEHKKLSRTLSAGKFKSGLADNSETITKYHTATHLLHAALRQVLGDHVSQAGSNITADRLRFDFTHPDKLNDRQISRVEKLINRYIDQSIPVTCQEMPYKKAIDSGALAFFAGKYPPIVSVYTIDQGNKIISKEVCTGPHVKNTSDIGHIVITKQESVGSGRKRLYAKLRN